MIAEILGSLMCILLILILIGIVVMGYCHSYDVYKEYREDLRRGSTEHMTLFFSVMLFIASTFGALACLLILTDAMGW